MIKPSKNTIRTAVVAFSSVALCSCGGLSKSDQETIDVPPIAAVTGAGAPAVVATPGTESAVAVKPAATPKPAAKMPYSKADGVEYVVESGDSLSVIAAKHGASMGDVMKVNGIKNANKIRIGQTLILPAKKSDAAAVIAETAAVTPEAPSSDTTPSGVDTSALSVPSISSGE